MLEAGKTLCEGSYTKLQGNCCPVCHKNIFVSQSNGAHIMAHTREVE